MDQTSARKELSFLARVRRELPHLYPGERRLAEVVLNFPGELASYTASELAHLANVSNASVTRFIRRLGYASFDEARQHVRRERETGAALFLVGAGAHESDPLGRHLEQAQANLAKTFVMLTAEEVDATAQAMLSARRVWVLGFRASHAFAQYLYWQTLQVIEPISLVPAAGETLGEHLAGISPEDCVVVFGLRRRPRRIDAILDALIGSGATVIYVSDEGVPPDPRVRLHARCHTAAPGPLFSHVSVIGFCHLLATRVIELAGSAGRRRLAAIETFHDDLEEI